MNRWAFVETTFARGDLQERGYREQRAVFAEFVSWKCNVAGAILAGVFTCDFQERKPAYQICQFSVITGNMDVT